MFLVFIQNSAFPNFGIMSISALLKAHGHKTALLITSLEKDLKGKLKKLKPDIVGFHLITGEHNKTLSLVREIKVALGVKTLLGGPHATYYPEETINKEGVDFLAVGEAEYAVLDLLDALTKGYDTSKIKNIWSVSGKEVFKNEPRELIGSLDDLPSPDRDVYYNYSFLGKSSVKQFLTGRGCPYECTFCSNHLLNNLYKGKGRYVRRISPSKVIEEIKAVRKKWGVRTVSFTDDVFVMSMEWLNEFLPVFKKEINLPFMCNVRVNLVTEELISKLKDHGCYGVAMGIESGNEHLRNVVLKKHLSNVQIKKACSIIKNYKVKLKAFNMIGIPGETFEQAMETLLLNIEVQPDFTPVSLLEPYPKYEITKYAIEQGCLPTSYSVDDVSESIYIPSKLIFKDNDVQKMINLQTFFFLTVKFPILLPLVRKLVNIKPNWFYRLTAKAVYGYFMSRMHRLTIRDIIRYAKNIDANQV